MEGQQEAGQNISNDPSTLGVGAANQSATPVQTEKTVPQSVVDHVVSSAKQEAFDRGRKAALEELRRGESTNHQPAQSTTHAMPETEIARIAREAAKAEFADSKLQQDYQHQYAENQRMAQEFVQKFDSGKDLYADYDEVTKDIRADLSSDKSVLAKLVPHLNRTEDMAHVLYDIAKNPQKIGALLGVADSPALAQGMLRTMAQSIKLNRDAANKKIARSPLDQITPSNTGMDSGENTIAKAKKKYKF